MKKTLYILTLVLFMAWAYTYFILGLQGLVHFLLLISNISLMIAILYSKRLS